LHFGRQHLSDHGLAEPQDPGIEPLSYTHLHPAAREKLVDAVFAGVR
jgi:hypothetical protein